MKAMYIIPRIEIMRVATGAMMDTPIISGGSVPLHDSGQAPSGTIPKAAERPY